MYVDIDWGQGTNHEGSLVVDDDGVQSFSDHCGCETAILNDWDKINKLHTALGRWLAEHAELSHPGGTMST